MNHGTYIGEREGLKGQGALLRTHPNDSGLVLAQFDSLSSPYVAAHGLSHGWHLFSADEFELDAQVRE